MNNKEINTMKTKLARIAQISREKPKEVFTSIYHLLNEEMLMLCHKELDGKKATGLDGITKAEYEENLENNIKKRKRYRRKNVKNGNVRRRHSKNYTIGKKYYRKIKNSEIKIQSLNSYNIFVTG